MDTASSLDTLLLLRTVKWRAIKMIPSEVTERQPVTELETALMTSSVLYSTKKQHTYQRAGLVNRLFSEPARWKNILTSNVH
jgi:hypothetical protein